MFLQIASYYMQGLVASVITVLLIGGLWTFWRARRHLDKTVKERQAFLYDVLMMSLMTAPILSFAFVAIILMLKA
ncbi:DUF4059 family protein [Streptococcus sp. HF-1907]|uniref:DUF4059 family protein n=1 Tax=Streptococcus sp. HF-1907 TaxID=2785793 RepID=UPI0018A0AE24|nr:DUF4059 family protein [Streptococcus sp. HF-1907]MBF7094687.1 DUF4059 family protein [Streptococcus sp. HF-1907]